MPLIDEDRIRAILVSADLDALVVVAPENTYYLSGVYIRTQDSIRERLAIVVWPRFGSPVFIVCNIEESLARGWGAIENVWTYVEFEESPTAKIAEVLVSLRLDGGRLGFEERYLPQASYRKLRGLLPACELVPVDDALAQCRAIKTQGEVDGITAAYRMTEAVIRESWARSREGDSEKMVAQRMIQAALVSGSDGVRHLTLASAENTSHPHLAPTDRRLSQGDMLLTDVGFYKAGYASDMARMGVVGAPRERSREEYRAYRNIYMRILEHIRPGVVARDLYQFCAEEYQKSGMRLIAPHIGHGLTRMGGHEDPILEPRCDTVLQPNMLLAVEPSFSPTVSFRYHLEDLVLVTEDSSVILTDAGSTEEPLLIARGESAGVN